MSLNEFYRYLENNDATAITNRPFNQNPEDKYPTFSICLHGNDLYWKTEHMLFKEIELTSSQFVDALKGRGYRYRFDEQKGIYHKENVTLNNNLLLKFSEAMLRPSDIIIGAKFVTHTHKISHFGIIDNEQHEESIPFHIGFHTPDEICFTRNSSYEKDLIREYDWISLNRELLEIGPNLNIQIWFITHYPGQLIREFNNPNFRSILDSYQTQKVLELKISGVTKLRRRANSNVPCNQKIDTNADEKYQREIISKIECVPIYWIHILDPTPAYNTCTSNNDLKMAKHFIHHFAPSYDPPCVEMTSLVTYSKNLDQLPHQFLLKVIYTERFYQEIKNDRDFCFVPLFSSVGGYLGLFLGYSLLQIPDLLHVVTSYMQGLHITTVIG